MQFGVVTYNLLVILIWSIIIGQLGKLPLGGFEGGVYLSEIIVGLVFFSWLIWKGIFVKSIRIRAIDGVIGFFALVLVISLLWALHWTDIKTIFIGVFYLLRLSLYLSLIKITKDVIDQNPKRVRSLWRHVYLSIFVFAMLGLLQFFVFPDFSEYVSHGWDPHYYRVLSTFFDPNYAGLLLSFGLFMGLHQLYSKPTLSILLFLAITGGAFVLTFSRSSYLACACGLLVFSWLRDKRLLVLLGLTGIIVFFSIPRVQERVIGAFTVDKTAQLRLKNYAQTFRIIEDNFFLGVGFNTYRSAQEGYGIFRDDRGVTQEGGHAGGGADNSFLFIWATAGIVGFISLLIVLFSLGKLALAQRFSAPITLSALVAYIAHSQFVNSLFFVWLLGFFLIIFVCAQEYFAYEKNRT